MGNLNANPETSFRMPEGCSSPFRLAVWSSLPSKLFWALILPLQNPSSQRSQICTQQMMREPGRLCIACLSDRLLTTHNITPTWDAIVALSLVLIVAVVFDSNFVGRAKAMSVQPQNKLSRKLRCQSIDDNALKAIQDLQATACMQCGAYPAVNLPLSHRSAVSPMSAAA